MANEEKTAFISYSREDSDFALKLANDLKAAEATIWLDQLDIVLGQRWARTIEDALNRCSSLVVILSPSSISSSNVDDEVSFALEEKKVIIPVLHRDCRIPFRLRPFQFVDFRIDYAEGLKALVKVLNTERSEGYEPRDLPGHFGPGQQVVAKSVSTGPLSSPHRFRILLLAATALVCLGVSIVVSRYRARSGSSPAQPSAQLPTAAQAQPGSTRTKSDFAVIASRGEQLYDKKQYSAAFPLFTTACDGGDPDGCSYLGLLYENGWGIKPDKAQALAVYRKGCDSGGTMSCNNLGLAYETGEGVVQDKAQAFALFKKACDGGYSMGCNNLGLAYDLGESVPPDKAQAVALFRKACDGGEPEGCHNLGGMYDNGEGVKGDPAQAAALYRKACDGGYYLGCNNLAAAYSDGKGVKRDPAQALALFRRACDGGDLLGCKNLGVMYENGWGGVMRDQAQAIALYRKACDGGEQDACESLKTDSH